MESEVFTVEYVNNNLIHMDEITFIWDVPKNHVLNWN